MPTERLDDHLEPPRVGLGPVLSAAVACVVLVFAAIGGLAWMYRVEVPSRRPAPPRQFPSPQLSVDEVAERQRLQAAQRERLAGYRWVDKQAGIVSIPIERAMDIVARRGSGAYDPVEAAGVHVGEAAP